MKRLLVALLCIFACVCMRAQVKDLGWSCEVASVEGQGDSLRVSLTYTINDWNVDPSKAVVLSASLRNGQSIATLRPVSIYGKKIAMQAHRILASGNRNEVTVASVTKKLQFSVVDVVPVRDWMDTVSVFIENCEWSKRGGLMQKSLRQLDKFVKPARPEWTPTWKTLEPEPWRGDMREIVVSVPIAFDEGSTKFDQFLNGNRHELDDILPLLKALTSSKRFVVRKASMKCYAAPKGDDKSVLALTKKRVQSVYSFLNRSGAFRYITPVRDGAGSDWAGTVKWMEESDFADESMVREILSSSLPVDEKIIAMKRHCPRQWAAVDSLCFPKLERIEFAFTFRPISLTSADFVRPLYVEDPRLIVPHDFYLLAMDAGIDDDRWLDAMLDGARLWPRVPELNLNAAYGLIRIGQYGLASEFIRNAGDGVWSDYVMGLWHCARGEWMAAEEIFSRLEQKDSNPLFRETHDKVRDIFLWEEGYVPWSKFIVF